MALLIMSLDSITDRSSSRPRTPCPYSRRFAQSLAAPSGAETYQWLKPIEALERPASCVTRICVFGHRPGGNLPILPTFLPPPRPGMRSGSAGGHAPEGSISRSQIGAITICERLARAARGALN